MKSQEFVSVYQDELSEQAVHSGVLPAAMSEAREWSHLFGQVLHYRLANPTAKPEINFSKLIKAYGEWANDSLDALNLWLWQQDTHEAHEALHELNFHNINYAMLGSWLPLLYPGTSHQDVKNRHINLTGSQTFIALNSITYYEFRRRNSQVVDDYPYYAPANFLIRKTTEGSLNELDSAIVSLQLAKKGIIAAVVPAPMQFEHTPSARKNVDFVIVSNDEQAAGLQIKSNVSDVTIAKYDDTARVVLVDTKVDFGNMAVRRITPGSSKFSRVGWGGILSISRVANIQTVGQGAVALRNYGFSARYIMEKKQQARSLIGDAKPDFERSVRILGERITRHFELGQSHSA